MSPLGGGPDDDADDTVVGRGRARRPAEPASRTPSAAPPTPGTPARPSSAPPRTSNTPPRPSRTAEPDPAAYSPRRAAPVTASRTAVPPRPPQAPVDGRALERAQATRGRRRTIALVVALAVAIAAAVAALIGAVVLLML